MNILYLCNEYPPCISVGGIGVFTKALAEGMHDRGHTIVVAGLYQDLGSKSVTFNQNGILVIKLNRSSGPFKSLRSRFRLFLLVNKIIHQHSIDLLETPDYEGSLGFWPPLPVPVIVRLHGSSSHLFTAQNIPVNKAMFRYEKSSIKKAALIIGVSAYSSNSAKKLFSIKAPIETIHNFISADAKIDCTENIREANKVVFTGTLMEIKGVFPLIKSWPYVVKKVPAAQLHLFGKDSTNYNGVSVKQSLVQMLPKGLSNSVYFHGYVDRNEIQKELRSASVAVFPSFSETFGLAPLEAMVQGCPTIFTKLASGPEIIDSGKNGILIDPSRPDEISNAIISLLSDASLSAKLGSEGRKSVLRRFSKEKLLDKNEALYRRAVAMKIAER